MKKYIEWLAVIIMAVAGLWAFGLIIWALLVGTYEFIYNFLCTLGARFIYLIAAFFVGFFLLIRCAEDQPEINGK